MNDDLISRRKAIDALEEIDCSDGVGLSALKCDVVDEAVSTIKALPHAQPKRKPSKTLAEEMERIKRELTDIFIEQMSAQPHRSSGRWTEKTVTENPQACGIREWQSAKCSVCGKYHSTPYLYSFTEYAFCPHCGSNMRGDEDAAD